MDRSRFTSTITNEKRSVEILEMLQNAEEKFSTKAQETLGFKKIKP